MLYHKLLNWLDEVGIRRIHLNKIKLKKDFNPFQWVLINILVKDFGICFEKKEGRVIYTERNFYLLKGYGPEKSDAVLCKNGVKPELDLPDKPYFIVDLSFWNRHTPKEKRRLIKQIMFSLIEIRKYLWDKHLVLTGVAEEFKDILFQRVGKNKVQLYSNTIEFLERKSLDRVIILDPDAQEELTEDDIKECDVFLIGGIVDLGIELKGETNRLFSGIDAERRVIKLDGSIRGVPDRINRIISILLKVRYLDFSLKDAIISEQTRKDILSRLQIELPKIWVKKGNQFYVKREDLEELSKRLFGGRELIKYLKVFRVQVI